MNKSPEPSISVIIPVKNRADLLKVTLSNLLAQSLPPLEVIVVDDGSTDHIHDVISSFGHQVHFITNEGKGPGAARNLGLKVAKGKYIQFFDSDDLMTKDKLKLQAEALEKTGADMAYGPYVQAFEIGNGVWQQKDVVLQQGALPPHKSLTSLLLLGWNCITQSCLFRSSFIKKVMDWDQNLITHEDYLYLFNLSLQNPTLIHTPEAAVVYRQHGAQSTENNTNMLSRSEDKLSVLQIMTQALPKLNVSTYEKWILFGRCYLAARHFYDQKGRNDSFYLFLSNPFKLASYLYRWHNKRERISTGTNWETMHAVGKTSEDFNKIISSVAS